MPLRGCAHRTGFESPYLSDRLCGLLKIPRYGFVPGSFGYPVTILEHPAMEDEVEILCVAPEFDDLLEFERPTFQFLG
jgi:hypothetical protein